jgi:hypothetical protein
VNLGGLAADANKSLAVSEASCEVGTANAVPHFVLEEKYVSSEEFEH